MQVGMIGFNPGNGHPFSFSAIVNGYDDEVFATLDLDMIHRYLRARSPSEFGFEGVQVSHVWTPDPSISRQIADACHVPNAVDDVDEMLGAVDAVVIARDDPESHLALARPFLERGIPTFVDKPLTMDGQELEWFGDHLDAGLLMSSSGLRYATELDSVRDGSHDLGEILTVRGTVPNEWSRYGAHILDAAQDACGLTFCAARRLSARHECVLIETAEDIPVIVDALGMYPTPISVDLLGTERRQLIPLRDNFGAFRRMLGKFFDMVRTRTVVLSPAATRASVGALIAGAAAMPRADAVPIDTSGRRPR